jgi:hypothetical protein
MLKQFFQALLLLLIINSAAGAQVTFTSIGAGLYSGSFRGNSTSVSGLGANVFIEVMPWFSDVIFIRASFGSARKTEYFFPENRKNRYYPFINVFGLKGAAQQYLSKTLFIEESVGIIYLNDRTFGTTNVWDLGSSFSVLAGIDFRNGNDSGFTAGLGLDYGVTFTETTASYLFIGIQSQFHF